MTTETFEQVLTAAQAEGSLTSAWKKFVNTKFFVPVVRSPDNDPKKFTLHLANGPEQGGPAVRISEVRERLEQAQGATLATLTGADVVRMLHAEAAILVALNDRAFTIAKDRVDWLKKGIEAAQARAAAKAQAAPLVAAVAAPVVAAPAAPAPLSIAKPQDAAPVPVPVRRKQVLDVAALKPRSVSLAAVGLEFFVPGEWREIRTNKALKLTDDASGTVLEASGSHRPNVSLMQWHGMRMALVQHEMRYLTQDGEPYTIDGDEWRDRVKGMATEFTGTFPGDDFPSRYLVACIRIDGTVASIAIRAPLEAFEDNRALYKWLLGRVDLLETAAIEARAPAAKATRTFDGDHDDGETPAVFGMSLRGRITRLQAMAYSLPVWAAIAGAGILAAVVIPKNQMLGVAIMLSAGGALLWLALRLLVLRLHDTNISGKWILYWLGLVLGAGIFKMLILMSLVAGIGWLAMMVFYCLVPGTPDDNDFGPAPGENSPLVTLGAVLFIVMQVGSVAAPARMMQSGGFHPMSMGQARPTAENIVFVAPDGSFTVEMPDQPQEMPVPSAGEAQLGGARTHMYQVNGPHGVYMAQTIDFGRGFVDQVGSLDAIQANIVGKDGVLIEAKPILLGGMKGRDVRASLPNGLVRGGRFVIVGSKVLVASIVTAKGAAGEAEMDAYLTSFKLP